MFRAHAAWGYGCRENTVWTSFVIALPGVDDTEIATIATHPDHQGQGLAGYLLQKVISVAALRGANRLLLEVAEDNLPARSLYTRHGFVIDGRRRNYYRRTETHCVDAILMSVDLKPPH